MKDKPVKQKKKILLVEDDPFIADIYQEKLNRKEFDVKVVNDGREAVTVIKQDKPDILLLDIVLPGIGGWQILRKLKKGGLFKKMKVIVLSNLGQQEEVSKGLEMGAVKYLIKAQFTPAEVAEEIKKIINN